MKKVLSFLLVAMFLIGIPVAFSEEEEFYAGVYRVGKDIKEGSYNIHLTGNGDGYYIEFESEEAYRNNEARGIMNFHEEGLHISAVDGMVFAIEIKSGGKLTIVPDKPSWMP